MSRPPNAATVMGRASSAQLWSLEQAMRTLAQQLAMARVTQLAALQQFYGIDELQQRWQLGRDHVVALLAEHGLRGSPGRSTRAHLDLVLAIDDQLRAAAAAQQEQAHAG